MRYLLILVAVLFFSCGKTPEIKTPVEKAKEKESFSITDEEDFVPLDAKDCDADFEVFFEKFKSDTIFQKQHVKFPYMFYYSDEDFPLDMMESMVWKSEYDVIDFSAPMYTYPHKDSPFTMDYMKGKDSVFCIKQSTLNKTTINYKFAAIKGCWYMVEVVDNTD
jgi:hypothetical protein